MQPDLITTAHDLGLACNRDPFVRYDALLRPGEIAYRHGSAVVMRQVPHSATRAPLACLIAPDDDSAADLLAWVARERPWGHLSGMSVERHREPTLHEHFDFDRGGDWDWMWSESMPRSAAEDPSGRAGRPRGRRRDHGAQRDR